MLSYKRKDAPNGLPGWRVFAGARELGAIHNPGPSSTSRDTWSAVAPDGTRFTATSKKKISEKLLNHASTKRQDVASQK